MALNREEVVGKAKGQRMVLTVWKPKKVPQARPKLSQRAGREVSSTLQGIWGARDGCKQEQRRGWGSFWGESPLATLLYLKSQ